MRQWKEVELEDVWRIEKIEGSRNTEAEKIKRKGGEKNMYTYIIYVYIFDKCV